jgi:hypothetical protein
MSWLELVLIFREAIFALSSFTNLNISQSKPINFILKILVIDIDCWIIVDYWVCEIKTSYLVQYFCCRKKLLCHIVDHNLDRIINMPPRT